MMDTQENRHYRPIPGLSRKAEEEQLAGIIQIAQDNLEKLEKESTSSPSNEFVKSKQIRTILSLTQSEYDALEEKDGGTMYLIVQDTEEDTGDVAG